MSCVDDSGSHRKGERWGLAESRPSVYTSAVDQAQLEILWEVMKKGKEARQEVIGSPYCCLWQGSGPARLTPR